jgi:hypothetical protein
MLARIQPFWSWHTPIAWTGYIFFVDGLVWKIRGESPLRNDRAEMVFVTLVSVPLWIVFPRTARKTTSSSWSCSCEGLAAHGVLVITAT